MYVYVFSCKEFVKVGITKDVDRRLSEIKNAIPFDVVSEFSTRSENYRMIERMVHKELSQSNVTGEWFSCSVDEAIESVVKNAKLASQVIDDGEDYHAAQDILNEAKSRGVSFMEIIWEKEREALHELIAWFGSQATTARALGVSRQMVNNWIRRGRISKAASKLAEAATGGEFKASRLRLTND